MRIIAPPGVFRPRSDSRLLADCARPYAAGARVLDLCTGSGFLALAAARAGATEVVAIDVSRRAVAAARLNARLNGVRVSARRGDLFEPVAGARFDLIVSNPPYLPGAGDGLPSRGPARAWEGGQDGRVLLDRICDQAPAHLRPGGVLLLVHSSVCGEQRTLERLAAARLRPRVQARRRGALGPLLSRRRQLLRTRGLLPGGADEEELLVVAAVTA